MAGEWEEPRHWRHVKRGTEYTEIGRAELQASQDVIEGHTLVIYRGDDGKWWARAEHEFEDGRFVAIGHVPIPTDPRDAEIERLRRALAEVEKVRTAIFYWMVRHHAQGERSYAQLGDAKEKLTDILTRAALKEGDGG